MLLCCLVASEAPRADRRRLSEFPACGVKLYLQNPSNEPLSGRGLEDVYCATSSTLEFVLDKDQVPVYIGVGCCTDAGVCHRWVGANNNAGCFAGYYDSATNVLPRPKTWNQAVELCHNDGKELCAAPLSYGIGDGKGCSYDRLYQWSTTECEPGDANYQEECETYAPTATPTTWCTPTTYWDNKKKRKDDATLLILVIVCCVAVFCCLLAISTAIIYTFGGCFCFAKRKTRRVAEPSEPPLAHATVMSEAPPAMSPGTLAKTQEHIRRTAALMAEAPPSPPGPPPLAPIKATETLPAEMP